MEYNVESIKKLFSVGSLFSGCCNSLIYLVCILHKLGAKDANCNYEYRNEKDILGYPLLTEFLESVGVVGCVICSLIILDSLGILTASVKCVTYTDVRCVEVGVSLKDLCPVFNCSVILTLVCMA